MTWPTAEEMMEAEKEALDTKVEWRVHYTLLRICWRRLLLTLTKFLKC